MSFRPNLPPSAYLKISDDDGSQKLTKGDYKKMKELEEARKSAQVPAMKDEMGKDINPHIPQYIMQAPWFYNATTPTLKHQRNDAAVSDTDRLKMLLESKRREVKKDVLVVNKFRKGACENCGGMGHTRQECCEKPRARLAKYCNNPTVVVDVAVENDNRNNKLNYDVKRDRYHNYDPSEHAEVVESYFKRDALQRQAKAKELEEQLESVGDESARKAVFERAEADESRTGEDVAMPGQKFDAKQRQSVRNLRLREDVPKYLRNLDPESAYYDPKSRTMRGNPYANSGKSVDEVPFAGDNYIRYEGDARNMLQTQVFSWDMGRRGVDVHLQADPTRAALLEKQLAAGTSEKQCQIREDILEEYGGREFLQPAPLELIYGVSEAYFEYDSRGRVIKGGAHRPDVLSHWEQDMQEQQQRSLRQGLQPRLNHSAVFGSLWCDGQWAYRCCRQTIKNSYCVSSGVTTTITAVKPTEVVKPIEHKSEIKQQRSKSSSSSSGSSSSEDEEVKQEKAVKEAMKREKLRLLQLQKNADKPVNRKRGYTTDYADHKAPTEADMEAYRRTKICKEDPMSKFVA